jgi:hypothetical protein
MPHTYQHPVVQLLQVYHHHRHVTATNGMTVLDVTGIAMASLLPCTPQAYM